MALNLLSAADLNKASTDLLSNYLVTIVGGDGTTIQAHLPETFSFDIVSEYVAPLQDSVVKDEGLSTVAKLAGFSTITQEMTSQFWAGGAPISISLPLIFVAKSNSDTEILRKIKQLMQMALPTKDGVFLRSPGPSLDIQGSNVGEKAATLGNAVLQGTDALGALLSSVVVKNKVQIRIGRFLWFDNVVLKNVQQTYDSRFDDAGKPLKAQVTVTFETAMTLTVQDMDKVFSGVTS